MSWWWTLSASDAFLGVNLEIFQWPIRRFLILSPRILLVAAVPTGLFKCKLQCKPCQMNKSARCLHSRVLVNTRNTERDISQPRKSSSEKLILKYRLQCVPYGTRPGMRWPWICFFPCMPNSAWADWNLADLVGTWKSTQENMSCPFHIISHHFPETCAEHT